MRELPAPDKRVMVEGTNYTLTEIRELRIEAALPETVKLHAVAAVVDRVGGDFDLALTALTMSPRPAWASDLLGIHPLLGAVK